MSINKRQMTSNIKPNLKLVWILLLAFGLRAVNLNQSLWLDEAIQWWASSSFTLKPLVTQYIQGDFNPPLFHVIIYFWIKLFGDSEVSLRLPSVIFGVATVYLSYQISQALNLKTKFSIFSFRFSAPEVAAALTATGPLLIYYSQEARMYSLAALTVTGTFYYLFKYQKIKKISLAIGYWLLATLALYSHYLTWLLLPLLLTLQPLLTVLAILTFVPFFPIFLSQLSQGLTTAAANPIWAQTVGALTPKNIALIPLKFLIGRIPIEANLFYAFLLVPPLAFAAYILVKSLSAFFKKPVNHSITQPVAIIWLWLALPLILGLMLATKIPIFSYFRFLFVLPAFYLLITLGISQLPKRLRLYTFILFIIINLISSGLYLLNPNFHRENWKDAVEFIHSYQAQAPVLIHSAIRSPFEYYDRDRSVQISEKDLEELISMPALWYIPYAQPIFDPEDKVRQILTDLDFQEVDKRHFRGVTVIRLRNFNFRYFSSASSNHLAI